MMIALAVAMGGCASSPVVTMRTLADTGHSFAAPADSAATVWIWRLGGEDETGTLAQPNQLTLEERALKADVEAGLREAGFGTFESVSATAPRRSYMMLVTVETVSGMYDTYRRVPVMESTWGHVHTRHGLEPYSATTSTDVIVPERRPYVHRIVTLAAIPAIDRAAAAPISPDSPEVVWRGRVVSDAEVIDEALPHHIANLLADWGATANRTVKYKREK